MIGLGWCSQVRASSEPQFGALREGGGTREAGSTFAERLAVLYRVGTRQRGREHFRGETGSTLSGGYAPDSAKAEGSSIVDEPGEG